MLLGLLTRSATSLIVIVFMNEPGDAAYRWLGEDRGSFLPRGKRW
jgi:hypothetical protein